MNYKKIITIFLFALIFQSFLFNIDSAQGVNFKPSVPIPGVSNINAPVNPDFSTLTDYIANFYKFAIGLTGILAVIMVTAGGMVWLTAGGNAGQIGKAKQMIMGSIAGLLLALFSYTLLYSINPDIVNMKMAKVISVPGIKKEGCGWQVKECNPISQKEANYGNYCGSKPKIAKDKVNPDMKHCCCKKEGYNPGCCIVYKNVEERFSKDLNKKAKECYSAENEGKCRGSSAVGGTYNARVFEEGRNCKDFSECPEGGYICSPEDDDQKPLKSCGQDKYCWGGRCIDGCASKGEYCNKDKSGDIYTPAPSNSFPCCAGADYCQEVPKEDYFTRECVK